MSEKNEVATQPAPAQDETLQELAKRAGPIARNARLDQIKLRRVSSDLLFTPDEADPSADLHHEYGVEFTFSPSDGTTANGLTVRVSFVLRLTLGEKDLFVLKCAFDLTYELPASMPEDAIQNLEAFARTNSMVHVWPYFRELVQSTTWRMGVAPFPLPLFRITDHVAKAAVQPQERPAARHHSSKKGAKT